MISRRGLVKVLLGASALALMPLQLANVANAMPSALAVEAIKTAMTGDFLTAGDMAKRSGDQAAVKLVELLYLRDHGPEAGYPRIEAFLNAAPVWPLTDTLNKRAEQALYEHSEAPDMVLGHFGNRKPVTPYGSLALARVGYSTGDAAMGKKWLRHAWGNADVDAAMEQKITGEFAARLSIEDHKYRLWRLILAQESSAAIRQSRRLSPDHQNAAHVAQALIQFNGGADKKFATLSTAMRNEPAMLYVLARFYRKNEEYGKARTIIASMPGDPNLMVDASAWFEERRTIVRRSVGPYNQSSWKAAYTIAKNHGLSSGDFAVEGEFLAGWVALRYLKDPDTALIHFAKLQKLAPTGTEKARAAFWLGRAHVALNETGAAKASFRTAAEHSTIYYGQLAREQLGLGREAENINSGKASQAAQASVERDEVVRAFRLMSAAGSKNQLNIFLWSLANRFDSVDELNAVAAIIHNTAGTSWALRFAKAAGMRGVDIDSWSYPIYGLPNWQQIGKPIEKSLVFALSRQESEFDPNAGSSVGAQGLMQLMPGTAKLVAKQYRIGYSPAQLKNPTYNVQLGSAHLADLVDHFNGSYILTLAAYNAGPRRSNEWVQAFGDPRGGQVDPVDWVECIPFNETRQYVQKVMQNVHVYRSRLAPDTVRPMTADLKRGQPDDINVGSITPAKECTQGSLQALISRCG
jgi:soluble lytic murein transglycosylase